MLLDEINTELLALATGIEPHSDEVAKAIRTWVNNQHPTEQVWLARWNYLNKTGQVLGGVQYLGFGRMRRVFYVTSEYGYLRPVQKERLCPLNAQDLSDAARARQLGLAAPDMRPIYKQPDMATITTEEMFCRVADRAKPVWQEGWQGAGKSERFVLQDIPDAWRTNLSWLEAYSEDGSTKFYAILEDTTDMFRNPPEPPHDAERRIPISFTMQLASLADEFEKCQERMAEHQAEDALLQEKRRLAQKFSAAV